MQNAGLLLSQKACMYRILKTYMTSEQEVIFTPSTKPTVYLTKVDEQTLLYCPRDIMEHFISFNYGWERMKA